jgi:polyprenyl-phospho-N-acetylgalactosaminyl synthase
MDLEPTGGVWVVIAAFNEEFALAGVVAGLKGNDYRVLVVDDGSTDATAEIAAASGAAVVRHAINLGQGAALQTGIDFALESGAEFVVTFDADGQHRPEDVAGLLDRLVTSRADFALGSRFLGTGRNLIPPSRRFLLRAATWFTRLTSRLEVTDVHNGLRAMTRRGARAIKLRQNRMAHASELLDQIAASGLSYVELPVSVEYSRYSLAKGQKSSDALRILLDLFVGRLHQ